MVYTTRKNQLYRRKDVHFAIMRADRLLLLLLYTFITTIGPFITSTVLAKHSFFEISTVRSQCI